MCPKKLCFHPNLLNSGKKNPLNVECISNKETNEILSGMQNIMISWNIIVVLEQTTISLPAQPSANLLMSPFISAVIVNTIPKLCLY